MVTWCRRKFSDAVEKSHRLKQLLIISVTYSPVNQTEDTLLQESLLQSFDFGDVKVCAVKVELDSVGANMKVFSESFPDVDSPGIIFVGLDDKADPKIYDKLPSICDLSESATPILEEYQANYAKFRQENPDFKSDNEEEEADEPLEEQSLEDRKKSVKDAIAKAKAAKAKLEEQEMLQREIQRIKDGKNALDMLEKIKEQNQRLEIEKQRKEKEADMDRLKQLRELEKRDREERARRKAEAQGTAQPAPSTPAPAAEIKPQQIASDECRICYQFPDGARVMKVFKSSVTFREVFDAIKDDPHIQGGYKLFTTFPRKAIEEYNKNLIELCLTPASVLAVVKV